MPLQSLAKLLYSLKNRQKFGHLNEIIFDYLRALQVSLLHHPRSHYHATSYHSTVVAEFFEEVSFASLELYLPSFSF